MKLPAPTAVISRNMDNKRAVLWDMDGVLVDSGELHYQSWLETFNALSIPFDGDKFRATFGMNNTSILTIVMGGPPEPDFVDMVSDRKEGLYRERLHGNLQLLPGVLGWLKMLHDRGILQAVASSAPQANIEAVVDELSIRQYFSALISAYSMAGKPDPAVFLEAARQLGMQVEQCVVVEDAVAGVTAAKKAGMKCIAVCTTHPRASLSAADIVVDNLEELNTEDFLHT
jgi:HAD superfamily hydrolase (TIGR01509 family)